MINVNQSNHSQIDNMTFLYILTMLLIYIIILLIIIKLVQSYVYYENNDDYFITSKNDFDKYMSSGRYSKSKLAKIYNNLNDYDKLFIRDLMCHTVLEHKESKPSFKKICRSATRQIVGASVLNSLVLNSSVTKVMSQNVLGFFVSNVI